VKEGKNDRRDKYYHSPDGKKFRSLKGAFGYIEAVGVTPATKQSEQSVTNKVLTNLDDNDHEDEVDLRSNGDDDDSSNSNSSGVDEGDDAASVESEQVTSPSLKKSKATTKVKRNIFVDSSCSGSSCGGSDDDSAVDNNSSSSGSDDDVVIYDGDDTEIKPNLKGLAMKAFLNDNNLVVVDHPNSDESGCVDIFTGLSFLLEKQGIARPVSSNTGLLKFVKRSLKSQLSQGRNVTMYSILDDFIATMKQRKKYNIKHETDVEMFLKLCETLSHILQLTISVILPNRNGTDIVLKSYSGIDGKADTKLKYQRTLATGVKDVQDLIIFPVFVPMNPMPLSVIGVRVVQGGTIHSESSSESDGELIYSEEEPAYVDLVQATKPGVRGPGTGRQQKTAEAVRYKEVTNKRKIPIQSSASAVAVKKVRVKVEPRLEISSVSGIGTKRHDDGYNTPMGLIGATDRTQLPEPINLHKEEIKEHNVKNKNRDRIAAELHELQQQLAAMDEELVAKRRQRKSTPLELGGGETTAVSMPKAKEIVPGTGKALGRPKIAEAAVMPTAVGIKASSDMEISDSVGAEADANDSGWPADIETFIKESPLRNKISSASPVSVEVSYPIRCKNTGFDAHLIVFTNLGRHGWHFRGKPISDCFDAYLNIGNNSNGQLPSVYTSFQDTFVRAVYYGPNVFARRKQKNNDNNSMAYPTTKIMTLMLTNPNGYGFDMEFNKFHDTMRRMMSKGTVAAYCHVDYLNREASGLMNGFLAGNFRNGAMKNKPYKNDNELKLDIKKDFEETFSKGFGKVNKYFHLDKHFCDYNIKAHLMSLGYNSFEDVNKNQQEYIYRNGNFPVWDDIVEEPISG